MIDPNPIPTVVTPDDRIHAALEAGDLQLARSLVHHWLQAWILQLKGPISRQELRHTTLWGCLADVVERTSDQHLLERFWQAMDRVVPPALAPGAPLPLLGVPLLNRPDLLVRLLDSLDHPVDTLAIVDNSRGSEAEADMVQQLAALEQRGHPLVGRLCVARSFGNAGVAASWNQILRAFPSASLALLANNDVQLAPGVLKAAIGRLQVSQPQFMGLLPGPQQFSAFLITAPCWDRIGLFDPGFHPAYCEDLDYRDRLRADTAVQWLEPSDLQQAMAACNPEHSATITSDPDLAARNRTSFALNRLWWLSHRRLRHDPRGTWVRQWLAEWKD